jgi:hypothetical protein
MKILSKVDYGSYLYGTNNEFSDRDYKGVYLPTKEQILLSQVKSEISSRDGDVEESYYSLQYFIMLACQGQTVALDMLHAPLSSTYKTSLIWEDLKKNVGRFYSKNIHAFLEYAKQQAVKYSLKGDRRRDLGTVIILLQTFDPTEKVSKIWYLIPKTANIFPVEQTPQGINQIFICGKIFQETVKIGYLLPILKNLQQQYGERAKLAESNSGIDWKAISHAVRVLLEVKELLTANTITFPLKKCNLVRNIKEGALSFINFVSPLLETLTSEIDTLLQLSTLPDTVDQTFWNNWLVETLEKELFKK